MTTDPAAPPSPPSPVQRPRRWPAIRKWILIVMGAAAVAVAVSGFVLERPMFLAAAWVYVSLPIVYLLARAFRERRAAQLLTSAAPAVLLAAVLGVATFVVITSCSQRLGPGAELSGCDLSGENLAGQDLRRANLSRADLEGANLRNAVLAGANLTGADLRNASVAGMNLDGANLTKADLRGLDLTAAGLDGAVFTQALLDRANLRSTNLAKASLRSASLRQSRLERASLEGADLSSGKLDSAVLRDATLRRTVLRNASLRNADLEETDLTGADLAGAILQDASLDGATMVDAEGLSDEALADVLGVEAGRLGTALIERDIRLESREDILGAMGAACRGVKVPGAARHPEGSIHPIVIVDGAGHSNSLSKQAANLGWEPMAARFGQLVACVHEEEQIEVQNCPYTIQGGSGGFASITRYQYRRRVRVVAARSGSMVFDQTYQGTMPEACQTFETFSSFSLHLTREGSHVDFGTFRAKLEGLVK